MKKVNRIKRNVTLDLTGKIVVFTGKSLTQVIILSN